MSFFGKRVFSILAVVMASGCQLTSNNSVSPVSKDTAGSAFSITTPELEANRRGAPIPLTLLSRERKQLSAYLAEPNDTESSFLNERNGYPIKSSIVERCNNISPRKTSDQNPKDINVKSVSKTESLKEYKVSTILVEENNEGLLEIYSPILRQLNQQYSGTSVELKHTIDFKAAEDAASAGLISFEKMRDLYLTFPFEASEIDAPLSDALRENSPRRRALLYQSAAAQEVPTAVAEVIKVALELARSAGLYEMTLGLYGHLINKLEASFALRWIGSEISQAQFYLGQPCKAKNWRRYLENISANDPDARKVMKRFWLWEVLSGVTNIEMVESENVRSWIQTSRVNAFSRRKLKLAYAMLNALDIRLQVKNWEGVLDELRTDNVSDILDKIEQVAHLSKRDATVKLIIDILGSRRLTEISPAEVGNIIKALKETGLTDQARKFAVEVAVANQL